MTPAVAELASLLAAAYLRIVARRAVPAPGLQGRSMAPVAQISAPSAAEIPGANEGSIPPRMSPPVHVPGGKAVADDGEER